MGVASFVFKSDSNHHTAPFDDVLLPYMGERPEDAARQM